MTEKKKGLRNLVEYIWDIELSSISRVHSFGVKVMRVLHLVFRGLRDDNCALHASALTFSTLMAIVPVLALSLAFARGVGNVEEAKGRMKDMVMEWTNGFRPVTGATNAASGVSGIELAIRERAGTKEAGDELADTINGMVDRLFQKVEGIKFKALGGIGLVILILMAIDVLGRVEAAFNTVWGVAKGRNVFRKFTDYLSIVIVLPVLLIAASSLPIVSFMTRFFDQTVAEGLRCWVSSAALKDLTMIVMSTLGFAFLFIVMPNTKVKIIPGLAGGFITALFLLCWLWICAALQVGVANYGKIYGSFAMVPILLGWIYVSWGIVILGAEVAFSIQNCATYRMEQGARRASIQAKIVLALSIICEAAKALAGKAGDLEVSAYAERKHVPVRFLNEVVEELVQAGFLGELVQKSGRFVLLKTPDTIKVRDVLDVIMRSGVGPEALGLGTIDTEIDRIVKKASDGINSSLSNTSLRDLVGE